MRVLFVLITVFVFASNAMAQRYAGEGDGGFIRNTVHNNFIFDSVPHWKIELSVDKSQNVTFHQFEMSYQDHLEFSGHPGEVYADLELKANSLETIDMNPLPGPDLHTFSIQPFNLVPLEVSGTYYNRGFERQFSGFKYPNSSYRFKLSFESFPKSLVITPDGGGSVSYIDGDIIELEPKLYFGITTVGYSPLSIGLEPLPPVGIGDLIGDSNLDGRFDSGDLVSIFTAGEYEDSLVANSTWATGDWNGDFEFDSGDLVDAFQANNYQRNAVAVPEPVSVAVGFIAFVWAALRARK